MGQELPAHLANPPKLEPASIFYFDAFNLLGTCRQIGFGTVGPIPYTAISQYGHDLGISGDAFERLVYVIRKVDEETLYVK